jgi:hypothetical protein
VTKPAEMTFPGCAMENTTNQGLLTPFRLPVRPGGCLLVALAVLIAHTGYGVVVLPPPEDVPETFRIPRMEMPVQVPEVVEAIKAFRSKDFARASELLEEAFKKYPSLGSATGVADRSTVVSNMRGSSFAYWVDTRTASEILRDIKTTGPSLPKSQRSSTETGVLDVKPGWDGYPPILH